MIVHMPTDRDRSSQASYELVQGPHLQLSTKHETPGMSALKAWLCSWVTFCYRFAGQVSISIDFYVWQDEQGFIRRRLDLNSPGALSFAELSERVSQDLARASLNLQPSNCSFYVASSEAEAEAAVQKMRDTRCELALLFSEGAGQQRIELFYDAALHDEATAVRWLDSLRTCWAGGLAAMGTSLDALPVLSERALKDQAALLASGTADYAKVPIYKLIEACARAQPDAPALHCAGQTLSYGELAQRSASLAAYLHNQGIGPGCVVGVCVRPSFEITLSILAIFKVGGIYLPLDPTHPEAYIQHMLDTAAPRLILLQDSLHVMNCFQNLPRLSIDRGWPESHRDEEPSLESEIDRPAYLFFTSGTTGKPKGVLASHRNLAHYIHVAQQAFGFGAADVFCSIARYTFSISLFDLLSPLCVGGQLHLLDRQDVLDPQRFIQLLHDVTVLHAGPSLLGALFRYLKVGADAPQTLPQLRHVSSGGDVVAASLMEEMKQVFPKAEIFVIYGSTEISCMGTYFPVLRSQTVQRSCVGRAFPDVRLRVLDQRLQPQPIGVVGEICFAGRGLTLGYFRRADLDAEKFIAFEGERYYRMGDMGRLLPSGDIEMLGRRDYQIQLRGMRIELVGIENTVREIGLAQQCALILKREAGQELLVAFVLGATQRSVSAFRGVLAAHLPEYMLPQHLVHLEQMPLTTNGKLDRQKLQELPWRSAVDPETVERPHDLMEERLMQIFCRVLGLEQVGVEQNFFDLGGHSLLALTLLQELRQELALDVSLLLFFEQPSIKGLLQQLETRGTAQTRPIRLNQAVARPALFMISGIHIYRGLAGYLAEHLAAFGVFAPAELLSEAEPGQVYSVEELARIYVEQIRAAQAEGPYRLLGYSFAGIVAYEAAQQLLQAGQEVSMLVLLDAMLPEWQQRWKFRRLQLQRVLRTSPRLLFDFWWRRLGDKWKAGRIGFARYANDLKIGPLEAQRDQLNTNAAAAYMDHLKPYDGPCLLIVSEERLRLDPLKSKSCGWRPYAMNLTLSGVAGDHYGMMEHAEELAEMARMISRFYQENEKSQFAK